MEDLSSDAEISSKAKAGFVESVFELHPDDELLARLWELDPETMSRLMPEIGNESEKEISAETPRLLGYARFAINSLRITMGRDIKLTPRQRMHDSRYDFLDRQD